MKLTSKHSLSTYRIRIPKGRSSYYLVFRKKGATSDTWITLDTKSKPEALVRGKAKFVAYQEGRHEALRATAGTNNWPTLEEIFKSFETHTSVKNPRNVVNSTLRIVEIAFDISRADALQKRADIFAPELVAKYRENSIALARENEVSFNKVSFNARLLHAKSLFTDIPRLYPGLKLPDVTKFRLAKGEKKASVDAGFVPLPPGTIERMETAAEACRDSTPQIRRAFLIFRYFGLRPIEAEALRGGWFEHSDGKMYLAIRNRPSEGFEIKNAIEHFIEVPEFLRAEFEGLDPDAFYIQPEMTANLRHRFVGRTVSDWVRQFIPGRQKTTYELRKLAGSEVYMRDGVEAAKYFLGHSDIQTTQKWYAAWLRRVGAAGSRAIPVSAPMMELQTAAAELLDVLDGGVTGQPLRDAKAKLRDILAGGAQ